MVDSTPNLTQIRQLLDLAKEYKLKSFKYQDLEFCFADTYVVEQDEEVWPTEPMHAQLEAQQQIDDIEFRAAQINPTDPNSLMKGLGWLPPEDSKE